MKQAIRLTAILLAAVLTVGLLPAATLAADSPWASDAVARLNTLYGVNVFSADDGAMTEGEVAAVLRQMGGSTDVVLGTDAPLTRDTACQVLADVFRLPVDGGEAIDYLYNRNILSGTADGRLDPEGGVTRAQFAVLTWRVLCAVGGGLAGSGDPLKPGTPEFFRWMYLATRRGAAIRPEKIAEQAELSIGSATISTYAGTTVTDYTDGKPVVSVETAEATGEGIWNAWIGLLSDPNLGGLPEFADAYTVSYDANLKLPEAADKLVGDFEAHYGAYHIADDGGPHLFLDVTPNDWWYDGILYVFEAGYFSGLGNGTAEPEVRMPLYEFAALLLRIDPLTPEEKAAVEAMDLIRIPADATDTEESVLDNLQTAMRAAVHRGYLSWADGYAEDFDPRATVTRQDAAADLLRACAEGKDVDLELEAVNVAILDRFDDADSIREEARPYLAYAVSRGMLQGDSNGKLDPNDGVTRGQTGVLLYRTLLGLDVSKMEDYRQSVRNALAAAPGGGTKR